MRNPVPLIGPMKPLTALWWCVQVAQIALIGVGCGSNGTSEDADSFDVSDAVDVSEADTDDSRDPDTNSDSKCSDTASETPVIGCPCTNQPGVLPYCCTRLSQRSTGWECGGLIWYGYAHGSCDGNPATCPECPLCPEAWEPDR